MSDDTQVEEKVEKEVAAEEKAEKIEKRALPKLDNVDDDLAQEIKNW